jgi:hypothetical protein
MSHWKLGIIGGSGLYEIDALENPEWIEVDTPWGLPSDALLTGKIAGVESVFLPRHGRGHRIGPTQLNYRANIDAMKRAGVTDLISISAVGSLAEDLPPGMFGKRAFLAPELSLMFQSQIRFARVYRRCWWLRHAHRVPAFMRGEHMWRWKGRNSQHAPKAIFIAAGALRLSA